MRARSSISAVVLGTLWTAVGCLPEAPTQTAQGRQPSDMGSHWVHDAQLRRVMSGIVQAHAWPEGEDEETNGHSEPSRRKALADAADLADGLARAARDIPGIVSGVKMSTADRRAFEATARTLSEQAEALKHAARRGNVEEMRLRLDEIGATCSSCHSRFRDFSGLLGPRDADAGGSAAGRVAAVARCGE